MKILVHALLALLAALWLAAPGVGGEGGENAGGGGVWILPGPRPLCGPPPTTQGQSFAFGEVSGDIVLVVSPECGEVVATATEPGSGSPLALPVDGQNVTLSRSVLQGYLSANVTTVSILIYDASQTGYAITMSLDGANESGSLTIN